jgi:hypothetical protein
MSIPVDGTLSWYAALRMAALLRLQPPAGVVSIGRRLKLSGAAVSLMQTVSAWRQRSAGTTAGDDGLVPAMATPRASTTFFWDTAPWEPEVVLIAAADAAARLGSGGAADPAELEPGSPARALLERWAARLAGLPDPPFDGTLLMKELGLTQGPALGKVLRETRLAWEAGEIHTLPEALDLARAARGSLPG